MTEYVKVSPGQPPYIRDKQINDALTALAASITQNTTDIQSAATAVGTSFTPAGIILSTDVQAALEELDTKKFNKSGGTISGATTVDGVLTAAQTVRYTGHPSIIYHADTTPMPITVAPGGIVHFSNMSGLILATTHTYGWTSLFICGGGGTAVWNTTGSTPVGSLAYKSSINGYVWTSTLAAVSDIGFFVVRTRVNG